ncbi:MAG: ATP-binding protein [Bdellovibrionales bacterium]
MKIQSLTEVSSKYVPITVEISLIPGLPQIHFLGRADSRLKECGLRIKSAFRQCGLRFPKAQQVVVNLTPSHLKKVSPGVELAVALGLLQATGQGPSWKPQEYIVFGELSLNGEVQFPQVSKFFELPDSVQLLSGQGLEIYSSGLRLSHLSQLESLEAIERTRPTLWQRPPAPVLKLTPLQADALQVVALGGHHVLLAGAQGSGKTLMAEVLHHLLSEPDADLLRWHEAHFQKPITWRPMARPHHTITPQSMVGGGVPPKPGDITRAHGGLLFLDEMMEFKPATLEALREALSSEHVTVSRGLQSTTFESSFQLVGATNLCPCGRWTPGTRRDCDYSDRRCRSVLQRLSGPLMDRIQGIIYFPPVMESPQVELEVVREQLRKARKFQLSMGRSENRNFRENDLGTSELKHWQAWLQNFDVPSVRRRQACVSWARTLADLEQSVEIQPAHFQKAFEVTVQSYERLFRSPL